MEEVKLKKTPGDTEPRRGRGLRSELNTGLWGRLVQRRVWMKDVAAKAGVVGRGGVSAAVDTESVTARHKRKERDSAGERETRHRLGRDQRRDGRKETERGVSWVGDVNELSGEKRKRNEEIERGAAKALRQSRRLIVWERSASRARSRRPTPRAAP